MASAAHRMHENALKSQAMFLFWCFPFFFLSVFVIADKHASILTNYIFRVITGNNMYKYRPILSELKVNIIRFFLTFLFFLLDVDF